MATKATKIVKKGWAKAKAAAKATRAKKAAKPAKKAATKRKPAPELPVLPPLDLPTKSKKQDFVDTAFVELNPTLERAPHYDPPAGEPEKTIVPATGVGDPVVTHVDNMAKTTGVVDVRTTETTDGIAPVTADEGPAF